MWGIITAKKGNMRGKKKSLFSLDGNLPVCIYYDVENSTYNHPPNKVRQEGDTCLRHKFKLFSGLG
jgi:hypothetical protein